MAGKAGPWRMTIVRDSLWRPAAGSASDLPRMIRKDKSTAAFTLRVPAIVDKFNMDTGEELAEPLTFSYGNEADEGRSSSSSASAAMGRSLGPAASTLARRRASYRRALSRSLSVRALRASPGGKLSDIYTFDGISRYVRFADLQPLWVDVDDDAEPSAGDELSIDIGIRVRGSVPYSSHAEGGPICLLFTLDMSHVSRAMTGRPASDVLVALSAFFISQQAPVTVDEKTGAIRRRQTGPATVKPHKRAPAGGSNAPAVQDDPERRHARDVLEVALASFHAPRVPWLVANPCPWPDLVGPTESETAALAVAMASQVTSTPPDTLGRLDQAQETTDAVLPSRMAPPPLHPPAARARGAANSAGMAMLLMASELAEGRESGGSGAARNSAAAAGGGAPRDLHPAPGMPAASSALEAAATRAEASAQAGTAPRVVVPPRLPTTPLQSDHVAGLAIGSGTVRSDARGSASELLRARARLSTAVARSSSLLAGDAPGALQTAGVADGSRSRSSAPFLPAGVDPAEPLQGRPPRAAKRQRSVDSVGQAPLSDGGRLMSPGWPSPMFELRVSDGSAAPSGRRSRAAPGAAASSTPVVVRPGGISGGHIGLTPLSAPTDQGRLVHFPGAGFDDAPDSAAPAGSEFLALAAESSPNRAGGRSKAPPSGSLVSFIRQAQPPTALRRAVVRPSTFPVAADE